jgi:signal transduction histidine kinase
MIEALAPHVAVVVRAVQLNGELERARLRVLAAAEAERGRLRRDLHDGLGPSLSGVALGLEAAQTALGSDLPLAVELLGRLRTEVSGSIEEVRRIIEGLRPSALDELGLLAAVRAKASDVQHRCAAGGRDLSVDVVAAPAPCALPLDVELAAYRIVDEALTNVVRHSGAAHCRVEIQEGADGEVRIVVSDDGGGLTPSAARLRSAGTGIGIPSMRARAESLGGTVEVVTAPAGLTVTASLPVAGSR